MGHIWPPFDAVPRAAVATPGKDPKEIISTKEGLRGQPNVGGVQMLRLVVAGRAGHGPGPIPCSKKNKTGGASEIGRAHAARPARREPLAARPLSRRAHPKGAAAWQHSAGARRERARAPGRGQTRVGHRLPGRERVAPPAAGHHVRAPPRPAHKGHGREPEGRVLGDDQDQGDGEQPHLDDGGRHPRRGGRGRGPGQHDRPGPRREDRQREPHPRQVSAHGRVADPPGRHSKRAAGCKQVGGQLQAVSQGGFVPGCDDRALRPCNLDQR